MSGEGRNKEDFPSDARGEGQRWKKELDAARATLRGWHESGKKVNDEFLDEEGGQERKSQTRWNLFWSGVNLQMSMLFGNIPRVDVSRRYADADDDAGRIAAEMQERLLNSDIERDSDTTATALGLALQDWRIPGAGFVRLRYVMEEEAVPEVPAKYGPEGNELSPPVPETSRISREDVEVDYLYWKDVLWSPCRVWHEMRWFAHASDISREKSVERFGEEIGNQLPVHPAKEDKDALEEPWDRIRIWEIWDKESRCVYWFCENYPDILDHKEDPLKLDAFWPFPKPLVANTTTTKLVPKSDYQMAQDQYRAINNLSTRIEMLQEAVKVAGLYDKKAGEEMASLLDGSVGNKLIPVDNWAMWAEGGGIKGRTDWLPLEQVVAAIQILAERRREEVDALYQITGQSDIMRGQASQPGASATEQAAKARFGSVRMQALQDEFARFTSDTQRLKAEIISKHFQPETIIQRSNAQFAFAKEDPLVVQQAVELIKSRFQAFRIQVKPESVALTDFAALRSEKTEVIGAISQFMTAVAPIIQFAPDAAEDVLEMLQTLVAGLKGAGTLEGTLDRAIAKAKAAREQRAANPQQKQDPKLQAEQLKAQVAAQKVQGDLQKEQMKLQGDLTRLQAETQAKAQQEQTQAEWNVREAAQKQLVQNALKPKEPAKFPGQGGAP